MPTVVTFPSYHSQVSSSPNYHLSSCFLFLLSDDCFYSSFNKSLQIKFPRKEKMAMENALQIGSLRYIYFCKHFDY